MFPSPLPPRRTSTRSVPRFAPAILLTSFVAAIVLASGGWAWATSRMPPTAVILSGGDTTVVWGPDTMRTLNGHHQTFVEAIGITAQAGKQYAVRLTRIGSGNLNEATVTFNHRTIASKSDFVGTGTTITLPVKLTGADTITVDVKGDNGVGLVVAFVSATDATVVVFSYTFTTSDANGNDSNSNSNSNSNSASDTTVQFLRPSSVGQPAYLYVNAVRPAGFNPASADIYLNGVRIIDHGDDGFAREVTSLALPVTLVAGTNTLRVVERGKSPTRFTLEIRATTTARPVLTITSPMPNAVTKNTSIVVTGTVTDATTVTVTVNGVTAALGAGHSYSATIPLLNEGSNPITVHAVNAAGLATDSARTVTRDTHPPVLLVTAPTDQLLTNSDSVTVSGSVSDATAVRLTVQGVPLTGGSGGAFSARVALAEGANFIIVLATDAAGNTTSIIRQVNRDKTPPVLAVTSPANGATTTDATIAVNGTVQDANTVSLTVNGNPVTVGQGGAFTMTESLQTGANTITVVATDGATNQTTVTRSVTRTGTGGFTPTAMTEILGADPALTRPAINPTQSAPVALATAFLYSGANPVQTGMQAGAIDSVRAGALRGRVLDRNGQPIAGVDVLVVGHPELGHTLTRTNGVWDLAANGGGDVIVRFTKSGVLPVQRKVVLAWQQIFAIDDVVMTPLSSAVTTIDFSQVIQVARGDVSSDASGSRRATMLFKQGTQTTLVSPSGGTQQLTTLHVRATEFTVGDQGPSAMPAELPPMAAYTYAVDLNTDEAIALGGSLRFSIPVPVYVENFIGFPVGTQLPLGSYEPKSGRWVPERNGSVVKILTVSGGTVTIDATGDGIAESAAQLDSIGIGAAERSALATLYAAGTTLWRWEADHFSAWDANFAGYRADSSASAFPPTVGSNPTHDTECAGCRLSLQGQAVGEDIGIQGTPFSLTYSSQRSPGGARHLNVIRIPVTGPNVVGSINGIGVSVNVAGRSFKQLLAPIPNQTIEFEWDGMDAYGRHTRGANAVVALTVFVNAFYVPPQPGRGFGGPCAPDAVEARCDTTGAPPTRQRIATTAPIPYMAGRSSAIALLQPDNDHAALGGWSLDAQHFFDPGTRSLSRGDGHILSASRVNTPGAVRLAGSAGGNSGDGGPALLARFKGISQVTSGADGTLYVADSSAHVVRRISTIGTVTRIAGTGALGNDAPGAPATSVALHGPTGLAVMGDGSLYIADSYNDRILRLMHDSLFLIAGGNGAGSAGDGGPADQAQLNHPTKLAITRNGTVLILDAGNKRVRELSADGTIRRFAGGGQDLITEGIAATEAKLDPVDIAVLADGKVAIAMSGAVRAVDESGTIHTAAGLGTLGSCDNHDQQIGVSALQAGVCPSSIAVGGDGSVYLTELSGRLLRRIAPDGTISQVRFCQDALSPNASVVVARPPISAGGITMIGIPRMNVTIIAGQCKGLSAGADGALFVTADSTIDRFDQVLPQFRNAAFRVASEDGSEVYEFSDVGRHLRTIDALTNVTILTFGYDTEGRIAMVTDADGNVTTIQRDGSGTPTGIVSPYGETTRLTLDGNSRLIQVKNPASESVTLGYTTGGLLQTITDPRQNITRFTYDSLGRVTREQNPLGGSQNFAQTTADEGDTVTVTDGLGRVRRVASTRQQNMDQRRSSIDAAGLQTNSTERIDGVSVTSSPDQSVVTQSTAPDPRFGAQVRQTTQSIVRLPSGLAGTVKFGRSVQLGNPTDPSSLITQTDTVVVAGQVFRGVYTVATRTLVNTSPEGRSSTVTLDAKGRVSRVATAGLAPISYAYDARGRIESLTQGDRSEAYAYDVHGRMATFTDPLGRVSSINYDAAGRVASETLPGGRTVAFAYDSAGNLTRLTPPGMPAHTFGYDGANLPTQYQAPATSGSTGTTAYSYSVQKELLSLTRPDSQGMSVQYDAAGRPSTVTSSEGVHNIGYSPSTGQATSLTAPHNVGQQLRYDSALPSGTTWTGPVVGAVDFTYDSALRLQGILVNGNGIAGPSYDRDGLTVTNGTLSFTNGPDNGLLQLLNGASHTGTWNYDSLAQVGVYAVTYDFTGDTVFRASYMYDKLGRITQVAERVKSDTATFAYGYDVAGRLATVRQTGVTIAAYSYDLNGNRTQTVYPSQSIAGIYDSQDRLISYGAATYAYTGNGELKLKVSGTDSTRYRYDAFGNLRDVFLPGGDHVEYVIDAQQRRIGRKLNGTLQQGWLYQSQLAIAAEVDASGIVKKEFTYGTHANVPDGMRVNGIAYRIVTDHLGSVRLVIAADGTLMQRIDYDAYGRILQNTNPGFQPFGYAGGILDGATGLTRFGARDYDAESGRWTSKDPTVFAPGEMNLYVYAGNVPTSFVDATGTEIRLQTHVAVEDFAGNVFYHAFIRITPLDQAHWLSDSRFSSSRDENGNVFVTLGAHQENGVLHSRMNRAEEIAPHSRGINLFPLLSCFDENALIERLLSLFANYQNRISYDFFAQWRSVPGYNSNSFAHGLISAAGLNVPHLPSSLFPAWNHPLPSSAFGKKQ